MQNRGNGSRSSRSTSERRAGGSGSDNPLFTSTESGQHIAIPMGNETVNQDHHRGTRDGSRGQTRGKQYHLGSLIELACQGDRKTTQRHVDGLSVDGQGAEVHNLYHLYAILSLAHQTDNARASSHYKEWSRLVSCEASTSRHRSDFYGLPTYDEAVALSHAANDISDVNVSSDRRTEPHTGYIPPDHDANIPPNITIPTYEELMGITNEGRNLDDQQQGAERREDVENDGILRRCGDSGEPVSSLDFHNTYSVSEENSSQQ